MQYVDFWVWLLALTKIHFRFIHIGFESVLSFSYVVFHFMELFAYNLLEGHQGYF